MSILEQCYGKFIEEFPESWLPNNDDEESVFFGKSNQIEDFFETCFILLSKSIISGEYISAPNFLEVLNNFLAKTTIEYAPPVLSDSENEKVNRLLSRYRDLNYSIYNALQHYNYFVTVSKNKFNTEENRSKYGFYKLKNIQSDDKILRLFPEITIPLCLLDYRFPIGEDEFNELLISRNRLMECISEGSSERRTVLAVLLHKCHFIIYNIKKTSFYINSESSTTCINPNDLDVGDYDGFIAKECDAEKANEFLNDINGRNPELKSFVLLMKYYKQNLVSKSDLNKMDIILKKYSDIYQVKLNSREFISPSNSIEEYNKFSYNSILNFLYNCRFSFYTQKCEPNLKQIKEELRHIENIQAKTGVRNFHPYEKAIEAIIKCIELHIEQDDFDDRLIEDKLEELGRVIFLYKESYEWSRSHQFFPFQLPFEESMYCVNNASINLFVPSAYAKYIDYNTLKERLEQFVRTKDYLKFRCDLSIERKEITQIKNDIKTSDKKAYDLIAIFTATITFLFGIVNIFINNTTLDLYQLIANTIGLGVLLLLFASLYLFISPLLIQRINWRKYLKTGRCIAGIVFIFIYLILVFTLSSNSQSVMKKFKQTGIEVDSLHNKQELEVQQVKATQ